MLAEIEVDVAAEVEDIASLLAGESAPDFSAENFEVDFDDRATVNDLTELGKRQMGLSAW